MLTNSYVGICHQTVNCFIDFVDLTTGAHIVQASHYFTTLPTSHPLTVTLPSIYSVSLCDLYNLWNSFTHMFMQKNFPYMYIFHSYSPSLIPLFKLEPCILHIAGLTTQLQNEINYY